MGRIIIPKPKCIYCQREVKLTDEHVIPESLGGTKTIYKVCADCNNGVLSQLDNTLVSKSPLAYICAKELGKKLPIYDFNQEYDVALEAYLAGDMSAVRLWPQIVIESARISLFADGEELQQEGPPNFFAHFVNLLRVARKTVEGTQNGKLWRWEEIKRPPAQGKYPPRVVALHACSDCQAPLKFVCRYPPEVSRKNVLDKLDTWTPDIKNAVPQECLSSLSPDYHRKFFLDDVARAFTKIGLNLLAHHYDLGTFDPAFSSAVHFVLEGTHSDRTVEKFFGFLHHSATAGIGCPERHHKFILQYDQGYWYLHSALFGGKLGTAVRFRGKKRDDYTRLEITVPTGEWRVEAFRILRPEVRLGAETFKDISPSVPMINENIRKRYTKKDSSR